MSSDDDEKMNVIFIIEIVGRPLEHLTKTLEEIVKKLGEEKDVKIKEKKINKPELMKDQKDIYFNFAEIEMELNGLNDLILLIFKYMPAHIEIIEPENLKLSNNDLNVALNELVRRLHGYDEIARIIQIEKNILERKLKAVLEEKGKQSKPEEKNKQTTKKEKEKKK